MTRYFKYSGLQQDCGLKALALLVALEGTPRTSLLSAPATLTGAMLLLVCIDPKFAFLFTEDEFAGFKLKGGPSIGRSAANIPGPLPRYGAASGLHYMLLAAPARQVRSSHMHTIAILTDCNMVSAALVFFCSHCDLVCSSAGCNLAVYTHDAKRGLLSTSACMQIIGVCRAKPLTLQPLDVLDEDREAAAVGPALAQLKRIQVSTTMHAAQQASCGAQRVHVMVRTMH